MTPPLPREPSGQSFPRRRHGKHTVYLRPAEAQKLYNALDALMRTDEQDGADPDLQRVRSKLYVIDWASDYEPRGGEE